MNPFYYHYETRNPSFLKVAIQLAEQGIKNHSFFLSLYDRSLVNIDPFDPHLTDSEKHKIFTEVRRNPWYFLRECLRVREIGGNTYSPYQLHRANLAAAYCVFNQIDTFMSLSKQCGKTAGYAAPIFWLLNYKIRDTSVAYMQPSGGSNTLIKYMEWFNNGIPSYLRNPHFRSQHRICNTMDNRIDAFECPASQHDAGDMASTWNHQIQLFDDAEFIEHIETIVYDSMVAFGKQRREDSARYYLKAFMSYYNKEDQPSTKFCMDLIQKAAIWEDFAFDKSVESFKNDIYRNSVNNLVHIRYDATHVLSDESIRYMKLALANSPDKFRREVLLERNLY